MTAEQKVFTVRLLAETLSTLPQDMEVWIRLDDIAGEVTHVKLGGIAKTGPHVILESL